MNASMTLFSLMAAASLLLSALFSNLAYAQGAGYDVQEIQDGVYVVSAGGYNSMFMTTGNGVVVVDAPPAIGRHDFRCSITSH